MPQGISLNAEIVVRIQKSEYTGNNHKFGRFFFPSSVQQKDFSISSSLQSSEEEAICGKGSGPMNKVIKQEKKEVAATVYMWAQGCQS